MTETIVFIGDSITDAGRRDDPDRHLGHGYVRLVAEELANRGDDRVIVNTGISGDRAVDLRARWEQDALAHRPGLLSIYVGINDTWRRYDDGDPTTTDAFATTYRSLLDQAQARLAPRFILMEPFVVPVTSEQKHWGPDDLDAKRAVVAALAEEYGAAFVPLQSILDDAAEQNGGNAAIALDGVHPTPLGNSLIAGAWLAAEATI
ncbi:SGNH/GDSL hydrolase family protein [Lysinimonas soli]|uniref:SGNH/GDSL hydrolase family protein n=1 Tax=Lysinimonas soli TaxID=1074233 RepID=A0ABW0NPA7_9MICO